MERFSFNPDDYDDDDEELDLSELRFITNNIETETLTPTKPESQSGVKEPELGPAASSISQVEKPTDHPSTDSWVRSQNASSSSSSPFASVTQSPPTKSIQPAEGLSRDPSNQPRHRHSGSRQTHNSGNQRRQYSPPVIAPRFLRMQEEDKRLRQQQQKQHQYQDHGPKSTFGTNQQALKITIYNDLNSPTRHIQPAPPPPTSWTTQKTRTIQIASNAEPNQSNWITPEPRPRSQSGRVQPGGQTFFSKSAREFNHPPRNNNRPTVSSQADQTGTKVKSSPVVVYYGNSGPDPAPDPAPISSGPTVSPTTTTATGSIGTSKFSIPSNGLLFVNKSVLEAAHTAKQQYQAQHKLKHQAQSQSQHQVQQHSQHQALSQSQHQVQQHSQHQALSQSQHQMQQHSLHQAQNQSQPQSQHQFQQQMQQHSQHQSQPQFQHQFQHQSQPQFQHQFRHQSQVKSQQHSQHSSLGGGLLRLDPLSKKLLNQLVTQSVKNRGPNSRSCPTATNPAPAIICSDMKKLEEVSGQLERAVGAEIAFSGFLDHRSEPIASLRQQLISLQENVLLGPRDSDASVSSSGSSNRLASSLQSLWQCCFYRFIDYYRKNYRDEESGLSVPMQHRLESITTDGLSFFYQLLCRLKSRYQFSEKSLMERSKPVACSALPDNSSTNASIQNAVLATKIYVILGDLARYRELASAKPNFDESKRFYRRAHLLMPSIGHILSQLSLVNYYQKDYFESIYYYIRFFEANGQSQASFEAQPQQPNLFGDTANFSSWPIRTEPNSKPSIGSGSNGPNRKQNLTLIFNDLQERFDLHHSQLKTQFEKLAHKDRLKEAMVAAGHCRINQFYRNEYWVRPDLSMAKCDQYNFFDLAAVKQPKRQFVDFYREQVLPSLTLEQLLVNFELSFLMSQGMLNCRLRLDNFYDVANQMLAEFDRILTFDDLSQESSGPSLVLGVRRLIQLSAIIMFTVKNTANEQDRTCNAAEYSFIHQNAYDLMSSILIKVLGRLIQLFPEFLSVHQKLSQNCHWDGIENDSQEEPPFDMDNLDYVPSRRYLKLVDQNWLLFDSLLIFVKIWADWFRRVKARFPPQEMCDLTTGNHENLWQVLARFLSLLAPVSIPTWASLCPVSEDGSRCTHSEVPCHPVQLPEDRCLQGFKLTELQGRSSWHFVLSSSTSPNLPIEFTHTYLRIGHLQKLAHWLCSDVQQQQQHPYLQLVEDSGTYCSLVETDDVEGCPGLKLKTVQQRQFDQTLTHYLALQKRLDRFRMDQEKDLDGDTTGDNNKNNDDDGGVSLNGENGTIDGGQEELGAFDYENEQEALDDLNRLDLVPGERRKLLLYRELHKQNPKHGKYFKIIEHLNEPKRRFIIRPRLVVFDTNCLINDLDSVKRLVELAPFTVTIPLIVIRELQSMMTRGQRMDSEARETIIAKQGQAKLERIIALSDIAAQILDYIQSAFASNRGRIKAVTSKGSLVTRFDLNEDLSDSSAFNNDDLVLYACSNLIDEKEGAMTRDQMVQLLESSGERVATFDEFIFRDVVMITDDVNLRVKALGYDVPVKKFSQFLKWTRSIAGLAQPK